jgi:hypothetical protein
MIENNFYINVMLFVIGLALIYILLTKQNEHPRIVRALLLIYFFVVLQYNYDNARLFANKILLGSAATALLVWFRQPIPSTE